MEWIGCSHKRFSISGSLFFYFITPKSGQLSFAPLLSPKGFLYGGAGFILGKGVLDVL